MWSKLHNGTRAVIYDDHVLFAQAFSSFLEKNCTYYSVHYFVNEAELKKFLFSYKNDAIHLFSDYYTNDSTALLLVNDVRKIVKKLKVIFISSITNAMEANNIMAYKPEGFISKSSDFNTIINCIDSIIKGKQYICTEIKRLLKEATKTQEIEFTSRETEMLRLFNKGLSIIETAEYSNLSKHTVVAHRRNMMHKTNTKSIGELLAYARNIKII